MKKQTKLLIVVLLAVLLIGLCYGYKRYKQQNSNDVTKNNQIKSNQTSKNSIDEKSKKTVIDKVTKAEHSKSETDITSAKKAVETLPEGNDKQALAKRINAITVNESNSGDFIVSAQYSEELFSSNLYVTTKDSSKIKGVTVNGDKLKLDDRYIIENGKVKIVFKKGTPKDSIGKVIINTEASDYEVKADVIK
ncbi:hypothetical protein [Clostridium kluyveri]|uniref:Uncharacterized protein n=1 Tax=Clostridium kluyveri TaxID=1534 RepID=A0A1L5FBE2_CLOKL|nr:hypothetical protein [Clostridium kluyveri]APM40341.1 hypothetical protein BS101_17175 [Clostridium kluyveri]